MGTISIRTARSTKKYAPDKNIAVPLIFFTELCKYFPNHIVLVSRNNNHWGYNDGWGIHMQLCINCLLQAGVNVVIADDFWRSLKPFAKDAFHTDIGVEPSALWVDFLVKIAAALTHGFVSPTWKRAARSLEMLTELPRTPPPHATVPVALAVPLEQQSTSEEINVPSPMPSSSSTAAAVPERQPPPADGCSGTQFQ